MLFLLAFASGKEIHVYTSLRNDITVLVISRPQHLEPSPRQKMAPLNSTPQPCKTGVTA